MELFSLIAFVLSLYAVIKVGALEKKLKDQGAIHIQPVTLSPSPAQSTVKVQPQLVTQLPEQQSRPEPDPFEKFMAWYAHEWPLKTGALFILLGFVWLVTYAFLNNWVGPTGRITFGIVVGALTMFLGERRLRTVASQGITLVGLGTAIITVTIYAAQNVYSMFPPFVALSFIILALIVATTISLKYRVLSLALVSLCIAGIAPILIGTTEKNIVSLYTYLLAITISTIWVARYSTWRVLTLVAMFIVSLYSVEYFFSGYTTVFSILSPAEFGYLRFFAITFMTVFFATALASIITNKDVKTVDLFTAAGVGFFTLGWINGLVPNVYQSLFLLLAAILYATAAYITFLRTSIKGAVYIYVAIATMLLILATGYEFEGPILIIAFSLQALLLPIVASVVLNKDISKYLLCYFIIPIFLSVESIRSLAWKDGIVHNDFVALTVVTLSLVVSGTYFYYQNKENDKPMHTQGVILSVIGAVYALVWLWKVNHALFSPQTGRMMTLIIYSVVGFASYITGEKQKRTILHKFGLCVLLFVVGWLLFVEVWNMELTMRIITFFLIGLMFIGSVLLRKSQTKQ